MGATILSKRPIFFLRGLIQDLLLPENADMNSPKVKELRELHGSMSLIFKEKIDWISSSHW
jgi:hypothetical protein